MICENCGAEINNRESYCPSCGMELMIPYSKSIKEKYIAGGYLENQDTHIHYKKKDIVTETEVPEEIVQEADQYSEARTEEYPEAQEYQEESGISILVVIILFLIVALLIGFVIGILVFSGFLHSLPGLSNL
jgi:hypothetical protein